MHQASAVDPDDLQAPEPEWLEMRWLLSCPRIQDVHCALAAMAADWLEVNSEGLQQSDAMPCLSCLRCFPARCPRGLHYDVVSSFGIVTNKICSPRQAVSTSAGKMIVCTERLAALHILLCPFPQALGPSTLKVKVRPKCCDNCDNCCGF